MLLAAFIDPESVLLFFHSLLRWAILLTVAVAGFAALAGWLRNGPVITWQRAVAIWAMVLCHIQLAVGLALYFMRLSDIGRMAKDQMIYWRYVHLGVMVIAIAMVTAGRISSQKARTERGKHLRVALFYLVALALMLWMIPWPFTALGIGRTWL